MNFRIIFYFIGFGCLMGVMACVETDIECPKVISIYTNCPETKVRVSTSFEKCPNFETMRYFFSAYSISEEKMNAPKQEYTASEHASLDPTCIDLCHLPISADELLIGQLSRQDNDRLGALFWDDSGMDTFEKYADCRDMNWRHEELYESTAARMYIEVQGENTAAAFSFDEGVEYSPESMEMKAALEEIVRKVRER